MTFALWVTGSFVAGILIGFKIGKAAVTHLVYRALTGEAGFGEQMMREAIQEAGWKK